MHHEYKQINMYFKNLQRKIAKYGIALKFTNNPMFDYDKLFRGHIK